MSTASASALEQRVIGVVREVLALEGDGPTLESTIDEDLGADSLAKLSLIMALEDEFGGTISEEEAQQLATLGDVVEYVRGRTEAAIAE